MTDASIELTKYLANPEAKTAHSSPDFMVQRGKNESRKAATPRKGTCCHRLRKRARPQRFPPRFLDRSEPVASAIPLSLLKHHCCQISSLIGSVDCSPGTTTAAGSHLYCKLGRWHPCNLCGLSLCGLSWQPRHPEKFTRAAASWEPTGAHPRPFERGMQLERMAATLAAKQGNQTLLD